MSGFGQPALDIENMGTNILPIDVEDNLQDLEEKYIVGISTADLSADSAFDAQVIVGKK